MPVSLCNHTIFLEEGFNDNELGILGTNRSRHFDLVWGLPVSQGAAGPDREQRGGTGLERDP
jgi:hypothetical protein